MKIKYTKLSVTRAKKLVERISDGDMHFLGRSKNLESDFHAIDVEDPLTGKRYEVWYEYTDGIFAGVAFEVRIPVSEKPTLHELQADLATHTLRLAQLQDPDFLASNYYFKFNKLNAHSLIPSYKNIIKSIKKEIKTWKK